MNSFPSAFELKGRRIEAMPRQEVEAKELPLQSLEKDKAEVLGFDFAFGLVLSGSITQRRQLECLVNPKFDKKDELVMGEGLSDFIGPNGNYIKKSDLEGIRLSAEQLPVLLKILEEKRSTLIEKNLSEAPIPGFDFAFGLVLSGSITQRRQLECLVNPKFDKKDELVMGEGLSDFIGPNGNYIKKSDLEGIRLSAEQLPVLLKILEEKVFVETEKRNVDRISEGFDFAFGLVLSGSITQRRQLECLVNPKFDKKDELVMGEGLSDFRGPNGNYIKKPDLEGKQITSEDFELLLQILNILNGAETPLEIKTNLEAYLQTNGEESLQRLSTILADGGDGQLNTEVNNIVLQLLKHKRIVQLKKDVYTGIVANKPNTELAQRISQFEGREVSDLELVATLQTAVAAKRKREIIASINRLFQVREKDINAILAEANLLLGSNRQDEREAGIEFVKAAYRIELSTFKEKIQSMITNNVDPEMLRIYIDGLPLRPAIDDVDYVQTIVTTRESAFESVSEILKVRQLAETVRIRESFARGEATQILRDIDNLPGETERDKNIKVQLLETYKRYVAARRPEIFDAQFAADIERREAEQFDAKFVSPEKGRNREAFNFLRSRFVETLYPLVELLRTDKTTAPKVEDFLGYGDEDKPSPRRQFEQRIGALEQQRALTETERAYLQSVEMLSFFNPYLIACAYADAGVTSEFLRHHFEKLSAQTTINIKDGDYFPLLQVGLGPNGLASLGEVVRNNPELASAMLVVDAGKQPGGPFAIPEGAAWELNSANKRGNGGRVLPKVPGTKERTTVRSFGSPLRWYPGERGADQTVRQGSINSTVDYLVTPDDLSTARYPTNEELQLILSMQAAVLTKNVALQTRLVGVEVDTDHTGPRDGEEDLVRKIVTLEITDASGTRQVRVKTDALFTLTGLGEAGYGFRLEGSRAQKVMDQTKNAAFPKVSQTLEGFNALAGRSVERGSPGETLVIWGKGNSADTLIEYIGSIFQGDNPRVRDITKVYVIADGDLSARPRYALINDLKPRNGRGNLIEQVRARVTDVDFATQEGDPATRKLVFLGSDGQPIKDSSGNPILGDSSIAATGFRSKLDSLLQNYATEVSNGNSETRQPVTLPTNENVSVAQTLTGDPNVLILGTASAPEFDSVDKLAQLPPEAREALLRNGAENAVAIGFRAPDTQAAVNIWLNSREVNVDGQMASSLREEFVVNEGTPAVPGEVVWLENSIQSENIRIPNNISDEIRLLSAFFIYNVGNSIALTTAEGKRFTGELDFTITYNADTAQLGFAFNEGSVGSISQEVVEAVKKACLDKDFQKYALVALKKKRRNPKLDLVLAFKNGFVNPKATFVQD